MLTIEALQEYGANTAEGMSRCMNNEKFYLRLVGMALKDQSAFKLRDAIADGDMAAAFEAAHALKGVMANLSLTPILAPASELTELLRANKEADYQSYVDEILKQRDKLEALCEG